MSGISSKAAGGIENKKKYNGIEFDNDLDLNTYEAFYRDLDPQTGRWWQVDPKTENMEHWSPYTSNYDNPLKNKDLLGDEPEEVEGPGPKSIVAISKELYNVYKLIRAGESLKSALTKEIKVDDVIRAFAIISLDEKSENSFKSGAKKLLSESIDKEINSIEKSNGSLRKRIAEHEKKRDEFKENPDGNDNKEFLKNATPAQRKSIIEKRIKHLETEIRTFRENIQKNNKKIEELRIKKDEVNKK